MAEKRGLGRGLNALLGDDEVRDAPTGLATSGQRKTVPITSLKPNPQQPRRFFDAEQLAELAQSIRQHGIVQPILVRPHPEHANAYEIVAGERRFRAAQQARLHEVPVVVQFLTDEAASELALIENLQRADLNPLEEALGYKQLMESYSHTQEKLSEHLGKSRSHIANMLRLLNLPSGVQDMLREGKLSAGHAKALAASPDPVVLAQRIVEECMSVREVETAAKIQKTAPKFKKPSNDSTPDLKALEHKLSMHLGCRVQVQDQKGKGKLVISYTTLDQLDAVIKRLEA